MVIEWVKDTIGEDAVKQYEDAIANEIERRVAPKVVPRDVPWA
jgi:hypothetical protein